MAQTWNDTTLPWQNTSLPYKSTSMAWNNTQLPWKQLPIGIVLSVTSQNENTTIGTTIGTLSVVGGSGSYTFAKTVDTDGAFTLSTATVSNAIVFDYETARSHSATFTADNGVDPLITTVITVTVGNIIETPVNVSAPVISGTAAVGSTLTASTGVWTDMAGPGAATYAYQWKSNTTNISGATASTFTPLHAQAGTTITVAVTPTNTAGTGSASTSAATAAVTEAVSNSVAPVVSGTTTVGSTLSTTDGTWVGYPAPSFTYQWQRNGTNIGSATASSYTLVTADLADNITCIVTATGGVNATSNSVGPVTSSGGGSAGEPIGLLLALTKAA